MNNEERAAVVECSIRKVILLGYNISFEQFSSLLEKMLGRGLVESYVKEHWDRLRNDFSGWLLNLDMEARCKFIKAALDRYGA